MQILKVCMIFVFSFPLWAEEMNVYRLETDKKQDVKRALIAVPKSGDNYRVGGMETHFLGFCLNINGECTKNIEFGDAITKQNALSNGVINPSERFKIPILSGLKVSVKNSVLEKNEDHLLIKSNTSMIFQGVPVEDEKMEKTLKLTDLHYTIDFAEVDTPSNRQDYSDVSQEKQSFADGVFKLKGDAEDTGLGGTSNGHGTGFFISNDGYAMTNLHVLDDNAECMKEKKCTIQVEQVKDTSEAFALDIDVLTCSKELDFCLIKADTSRFEVKKFFDPTYDHIPKHLLSLGYPGDRNKEGIDTPLTYTCGSPVGFSGTGVTSNLYIYGGASGSPIIDELGNDVFGILSNGSALGEDGNSGMPGIFRPLVLIEEYYGISNYLNGNTQKVIDLLVEELKTTSSPADAKAILEKFKSKRSFYGISELENMTYSHKNEEIRKLIFKFIKKIDTVIIE